MRQSRAQHSVCRDTFGTAVGLNTYCSRGLHSLTFMHVIVYVSFDCGLKQTPRPCGHNRTSFQVISVTDLASRSETTDFRSSVLWLCYNPDPTRDALQSYRPHAAEGPQEKSNSGSDRGPRVASRCRPLPGHEAVHPAGVPSQLVGRRARLHHPTHGVGAHCRPRHHY